ncbi:MAG: bifunctional (p)ppGpp synthetase/guanosine-3',5'-bis(diphosphate) 3'-pyrophosphohydrolase [Acidobacteriota bacterium]|nr:bifunctional (p)ppGpp synthetase/guanosine-3',5'-bis(diphosphate) 3'-pyrophosphohydrolase [Acidobacteriota bacterium]
MRSRHRIPAFADGHPNIEAALEFAQARHAGQRQGDGTPYLSHPIEVASCLYRTGAPEHLIIAGLLHDVLEKTDVSASMLRRQSGRRVAGLVVAVTDDARIGGYATRKAALRQQVADAGDEALALFAADKLSKLRELRREIEQDQAGNKTLRARRLKHYQRFPGNAGGAPAGLAAGQRSSTRATGVQLRAPSAYRLTPRTPTPRTERRKLDR